ncbi:MAG: flavodoxin family protein [Spirochaetes bacterium]|nr:flavodoxin family protein [Spirochaetota bacterium]
MTVVALYGSPHRRGFSSALHDILLERLASSGWTIRRVYAYDESIAPCTDCGFCRDRFECVHRDAMESLYGPLCDAGAITVSSPVYFSSFPGQLKNLIDRCQVVWEKNRRSGGMPARKRGYLILTSGRSYPNVFSPSIIVARHFFNTMNCAFDEGEYFLLPDTEGMAGPPPESASRLEEMAVKFGQSPPDIPCRSL